MSDIEWGFSLPLPRESLTEELLKSPLRVSPRFDLRQAVHSGTPHGEYESPGCSAQDVSHNEDRDDGLRRNKGRGMNRRNGQIRVRDSASLFNDADDDPENQHHENDRGSWITEVGTRSEAPWMQEKPIRTSNQANEGVRGKHLEAKSANSREKKRTRATGSRVRASACPSSKTAAISSPNSR